MGGTYNQAGVTYNQVGLTYNSFTVTDPYTAVPAGGNWSAGATWVGGVVPTAANNVYLDAASGNVTIDAVVTARSLDCTGYTGTLTHNAGFQLNLGDATAGAGNIALKFVPTMTYTIVGTGVIGFQSTSATQQTLTTGGKTVGTWSIDGAGSSYILTDAMTQPSTCTMLLTRGTFNTANFACSWGFFTAAATGVKALTLGSSAVTISGINGQWLYNPTTSVLTVTANTAVITFTNTAGTNSFNWSAGTTNGMSVSFPGSASASVLNSPTLVNVTYVGPASRLPILTFSGVPVVTGTLTVTGNSTLNRIIVKSSTIGTAMALIAAAVSFSNVDFQDVTAAGAVVPWTGTSMGDALGCSNITFDAPTTQTHTASAGGNWSDVTKWSTRVPLPQDNVIVDVNTTGTLTADMPRLGADITFAGFAGTAAFAVATTMYGSLVWGAGMTLAGSGVAIALLARSSKTITSNGKQFTSGYGIGGPGGTYTLTDALSAAQDLSVVASSTFTTNNFPVTVRAISGGQTGGNPTSNYGTSTVTLTDTTAAITYTFSLGGSSSVLNASQATMVIANASATARKILLQGRTWGTITYTVPGSTGSLEFTNAGTVGTLNFSDASNVRTLLLASGTTFAVTNLNVVGTTGKLMSINSTTAGTAATISVSTGVTSLDYLNLKDITATGGAVFYAGPHSTNVSGNTGWNFQKLAAAGGGNWSAGATWVGGVVPTAADAVNLDAASGNVTIDAGAVARAVDCIGYTGVLTHGAGVNLTLGDATPGPLSYALRLRSSMTYANTATSVVTFVSTSTTQQSIITGGQTLGHFQINGANSSYVLGDANTTYSTSVFTLSSGIFDTGSFACSWGFFSITGGASKTLTLRSSAIAISGVSGSAVNYSGSGATFTANTAVMTLSGSTAGIVGGVWNGTSAVFTTAVTAFAGFSGTVTLNNVTYNGPVNKSANFQLSFGTLVITGTLTMAGNSVINRILFSSNIIGTNRTVTAAAVALSNVDFQDITAAGASGTWTGTSMGNALGCSNITFDTPVTQTHTASTGGNWSDVTKWSTRVPLPQDNVIVDVNTTGTLTADMPRLGADLTFTGFAGTFGLGVAAVSYGNVTMSSGMANNAGNTWTLQGRSIHTLASAGVAWGTVVNIQAVGGTYRFVGDFSSTISFSGLALVTGTLDAATNNVNVTLQNFSATTSGSTLNMGTGTWTMTRTSAATVWNVVSGVTVSGAVATIAISTASTSARTITGGGKTYGTLTYTVPGSTGSLTFNDGNTVGTLNFSDVTNVRSLLFTAGTTTTITNWNVNGTAGKLMTIDSTTAANHTLSKPSGTVSSDYLSISRSTATGGAGWYAGTNSVDGGNNTGWIYTAPPTPVTLSGDGTLTIGGTPRLTGAVALSGTGTLTMTGIPLLTSAVALSGTGTLTVGGSSWLDPISSSVARWNVLLRVSTAVEARWALRTLTDHTTLGTWHVRALTSHIATGRWTTLAVLASSAPASWAVRAFTVGSVQGTWDVHRLITTPYAARWMVRAFVPGSAAQGTWSLRSLVAPVSWQGTWSLRALVAPVPWQGTWSLRAFTATPAQGTWSLRHLIDRAGSAGWDVRHVIYNPSSGQWTVLLIAGNTASGTWGAVMLTSPDVRHPEVEVISTLAGVLVH